MNKALFDRIVDVVKPHFFDKHERQTLMSGALPGSPVLELINWEGDSYTVSIHVVDRLLSFDSKAPYASVVALLQAIHERVGVDHKPEIEAIIVALARAERYVAGQFNKDRVITELVRHFSILGDLTEVEQDDFRYVGYRRNMAAIELMGVVIGNRELTEAMVRVRCEQFFKWVRTAPQHFDLRRALNPNGVLLFVFVEDSPTTLMQFITRQSIIKHDTVGGVIVPWVVDLKRCAVYSHNNPVSLFPPVVIFPQFAFPKLVELQNFVSGSAGCK